MKNKQTIKIECEDDAQKLPVRVAYIKKETSIAVERDRDEEVMSFPHLIVREILAFEILMIVLVLWSLFFDAPLESIADPQHSPNPAKAPWYFLGLQELLHYFPPLVAGVILPTLVVIALVVIPYFRINLIRETFWTGNIRKRFILLSVITLMLNIPFIVFKVVPIFVCSAIIYTLMILPLLFPREKRTLVFLRERALADWIMMWFVLVAVVLTSIGTLFRGPEWRWAWPWIEGIY